MQKLNINNLNEIIDALNQEKVVAIPTDTIYGFSCLATSDKAVQKIYDMKKRSEQKSFIILVSANYDLSRIVKDQELIDVIRRNTPAPLTMVVNKSEELNLSKSFYLPTIAIRIPDNEFLQRILDKVGYMVSTSCNVQGEPNLNDYESIVNAFPDLDAIIEFKTKKDVKASTIVDLTSSEYKILRQGDYNFKLNKEI